MEADASDSEVSNADFCLAESRTSLATPSVSIETPDGELTDILANSSISESRIPSQQRTVVPVISMVPPLDNVSAVPMSKKKRLLSGVPPLAPNGFTQAQEEFLSTILDALCDVSKKVNTMSVNLDRLDKPRFSFFQTSGRENDISPRELEAVDTVTSPAEVTKPLSSGSATQPPDRATIQEIPDEDTEMPPAERASSAVTKPPQKPPGACGIGARHKSAKSTNSKAQSPPKAPPINWGTWRTPKVYNAQGTVRPLIMEEEEGWYDIPPTFNPSEPKVYEPIKNILRRAKKEQEAFRNTVSHASYLSEAANTNRLPLWAYGVGPVPGYFDKEDPRWGPLFELTHAQAIERVRCVQDIMETRAQELSQLYLGDMENLAYLVRAHPSMLGPLEMKIMAYANTTHRQKMSDHWQSLASAPSPTAVNVEIKRRVISSAGTEPSTSGGRPEPSNQQPQAAEKENQSDNRVGNRPNNRPAFPKGRSKSVGKGKGPRNNRGAPSDDLTPAEEAKVVAYIRNLKRR